MPVIEINGDISGISKDNKVDVFVKYHSKELNFNSNATLKWQGSSSLFYEKKNYTINFVDEFGEKNKILVKDEWGSQNKYCLKANYIDHTSARNVVSAKIFGQIVHSRNKSDELHELVNGGAIDGFPVAIYMNNNYQGLYTFNIPKDKWLFDMNKNGNKAILMADGWGNSTKLKERISTDYISSNWELEYCSTGEEPEESTWVVESFNNLIDFLNNNNGDDFKNGIANYTDIDRAMDLMLYTLALNGLDNLSKNILWVTYDGIKWIPSAYDLDSTWGIYCDGTVLPETEWMTLEEFSNNANLLWQRILENYKQEVKDRYIELRESVLSTENIITMFANFINDIPTDLYKFETYLYPKIPSQKISNLSQIAYFAQKHLSNLDTEFTNY